MNFLSLQKYSRKAFFTAACLLIQSVLLQVVIITVSQAATIKVTLDVGVFIQDSDGVPAIVYGVNGITNAPIVMSMGDVLEATVKNNLNESTSIHWHGIFQRFTNDQDGADMATQCGIPPGQSLVYSFPIPDQAGTFWWHAHKGAQYIKGLRGPLIVLDPNDPYENAYDDEIVMTLSDWYHGDLSSIIKEYLSPGGDGSEPAPDSVVLNDLGQYNCTMEGREEGDHNQVKCKAPPVFSVVRGKSYRIRIINMAAMGSFNFSIDGHKMSVIEADGTTTQRIDGIDILNIAPAQRYSVIVTANQSTDASSTAGVGGGQGFWIRSHLNTKSWPQELLLKPQVLGVFNYIEDDGVGGENSTTTTTSDPSSTPPSSSTLPLLIPTSTPNPSATRLLDIYSLFPLTNTSTSSPSLNQPPPFPTTPNLSLDLNFQFTSTASTNITRAFVSIDGFPDGSSIISSSYYPPKIPTLFSVVDGDLDGIPGSSNVVYLEQGDVVDVTVYNPETEEHPFHLHGHSFWVIQHGRALNFKKKIRRNNINSHTLSSSSSSAQQQQFPYRDTVGITGCKPRPNGGGSEGACGGGKGYTKIRFIASTLGAHLFHCHMEWHMASGLAMTFVVGAKELSGGGLTIPQRVRDTCLAVKGM